MIPSMAGFMSSTVSAVPNIVGLTRTNANLSITNQRLVVGTQTATTTENLGIDQQVISQSPVSGTGVAIGSSVNYNYYQYSAPPEPTTCRINAYNEVYGNFCYCSSGGAICYFFVCAGEAC